MGEKVALQAIHATFLCFAHCGWVLYNFDTMQITPYAKNAKKHPQKQVEQVANSIKEFGMNQPIVVDKQGVIIVGHGRYEALKSLGMEIKDEYIKVVDLTEEQAKAYRLADNKLNESDWDMDLVIEELKSLSEPMVELTGFDSDLLIEPDEKDDEVPDVPEEPQSKLGDLYELGEHRVLCGDSTKIEDVERLMDGKKADMVFTDPPYGVDYSGGIQFTKDGVKKEQRERLKDDHKGTEIYADVVPILASYCDGPIYTWFSDTQALPVYQAIEAVGDIHALLIWKKNGGYAAMNSNYKQKHEPCLYWKAKGKKLNFVGDTTETTVWEIDKDGRNKLHPTQKPVALALKAIMNHSVGRIMDLFLGSGSTLIASEKTGRVCYGMELSEKYTDVIVQRYVDYTGKTEVIKNGEKITWKKTESKPS